MIAKKDQREISIKRSNPDLVEHCVACFVSPHGFGHAARAAGLMTAMNEIDPSIRFEIFTKVPSWFFQDSPSLSFNYHSLLTDIGIVQKSPFQEDLSETLKNLNDFLPFDRSRITSLAKLLNEIKCELIICDIAPMGILTAREAGIPSVLVENFTWDWIYGGYTSHYPRIKKHIAYLQRLFDAADYHVQTEPVCCRRNVDLTLPPISRKVRTPAPRIREKLGIPADSKMVTITVSGILEQYVFLEELSDLRDVYFVIPGGSQSTQVRDNLVLLPNRSEFFHPDLINASDCVIGKAGYSTIAEVYYAGVPFGYITRPNFRESEVLEAYIKDQINSVAITEEQFRDGSWLSRLQDLLTLPRIQRKGKNGADQAARFICDLLHVE